MYAEQGVPGHIPPWSALTFDVQLLEIDGRRVTDADSVALNVQLQQETKEKNLTQWVDEMSLNSGKESGSKKKGGSGKGGKPGKGKKNKKKKKKKR